MPRTFSTKPAYSVRYWKSNNLTPPEINVLTIIRRRVERLQLDDLPDGKTRFQIHTADSRLLRSYEGFPTDINLCISSPPYYGMRTYVADQWLRNWFIGNDPEVSYREENQVSHISPEAFAKSLSQVWNCVGRHLADNSRMFIRFGSIPCRKQDSKALMLRSIELSDRSWKVIRISRAHSASNGKRQAMQMGNRIKSTAIEEHDFEIAL